MAMLEPFIVFDTVPSILLHQKPNWHWALAGGQYDVRLSLSADRFLICLIDSTRLILQILPPRLPFSSVIIVEPMVSPGGTDPLEPLRKRLVAAAENRRDTWASRDEVRLWLLGRRQGSGGSKRRRVWDRRVVDAIVVGLYIASLGTDRLISAS